MKFIVTAGGQGTKIWPYSRKDKPKQFQNIVGNESLFAYNVKTLLKKYTPQDIYISTKKSYVDYVKEQAPQIPENNYIIEPDIPRHRGPAEGLAFLVLSIKHPDEPFFLVQSDCIRLPENKYLQMIEACDKLAQKDKKFITGGIRPSFPQLGVDYFRVKSHDVTNDDDIEILEIEEFVYRNNDYEQTKLLVEEQKIVTHCNHACWYPNLIMAAYKKHRPDWYEALMQIKECFGKQDEENLIEQIYSSMSAEPTEKVTEHVFADGYVVNLPFKWIDIGTWNSLYEYASKGGKNHEDGQVISIESTGTLVKSDNSKKLIVAMGLSDMVIVDTADVLLVVPRNKADRIKDIHNELEQQKLEEYL